MAVQSRREQKTAETMVLPRHSQKASSATKTKDGKSPSKNAVNPRASVSPRAGISPRAAANRTRDRESPRANKKAQRDPPARDRREAVTERKPSTPKKKSVATIKPPATIAASAHSRAMGASVNARGGPAPAPVSIHSRAAGVSASAHSRQSLHPLQVEEAAGPRGGADLSLDKTPRRRNDAHPSRYAPDPGQYVPPTLSGDTIDDLVQQAGHTDDKYRTVIPTESNSYLPSMRGSTRAPASHATSPKMCTINPPAVREYGQHEPNLSKVNVSTVTTGSFADSTLMGSTTQGSTIYSDSQNHSRYLSGNSRFNSMSMSSRESHDHFLDPEDHIWSEEEYSLSKQKIAFVCIGVSAIQFMILLIQMILCGVASVDVNPMIGPFPDAFSEWGGKNAYLMLDGKQYWRALSPVFLHVGVLHLLTNVFCQLETCAFFEREWGSGRWLFLYIVSGLGCVLTSCVVNPDIIGVCSSGAIMGLFGAKFAQIVAWTSFDLQNNGYYDMVRLDQLGGLMCSTALISILAFFTYIDFSGHMGGLVSGFLGGMFIFSRPIESTLTRVLWGSAGLIGLLSGGGLLGYLLYNDTFPDPDLADPCGYFRNLFPEGYDCDCVWN